MQICECEMWTQFLEFAKKNCSAAAFENWLAPIQVIESSVESLTLEVPNVFVKEYLLDNYKKDLCAFLPIKEAGEPSIHFVIGSTLKPAFNKPLQPKENPAEEISASFDIKLNNAYRFETFIEGPSNQFAKSAAMGVASRPGKT